MQTKLTLLAVLLLGTLFLNAQVVYDTYADGSLRLLSERKEEWDMNNLLWDQTDSNYYTYNLQGRVQEKQIHYSPTNGTWNYSFQRRYSYTPSGKNQQIVDTNFFTSAACNRATYTYNNNDQPTLELYERVAGGNWIPNLRYQKNYTPFDSLNVLLSEGYLNNIWKNSTRQVHSYNAQNRDTMVTNEIWISTNQWRGATRYIYTINANGQLDSYIYQQYDTVSASYKNYTQFAYTYDGNNRLLFAVQKFWDIANSNWANSGKSTYTYNANGDIDQILAEEWDYLNLEWTLFTLQTLTYDASNRLTGRLLQQRVGSSWVGVIRTAYTYNQQGYMTEEFSELWNTSTLAWRNNTLNKYWYEANPLFNSITESEPVKLFVYPNPGSGPVTFANADKSLPYTVYDMQGRIIQQGEIHQGTNNIIINEAKGTYILKAGNSSTILLKQ